ncbi:hypothetical protein [Bradyrhizobium sp. Ash2021]|uniref:hypothetical protein n=1 Tax=Bradyrhizobium sp. Ash2021 TaxID=2954771 RepID=UPI0028165FD1|nr:hypothetical protein [Bradyrhizobium sp. Ash2021]WMT71333.1 hypothetical protein NL528_24890 [Bradyrhizobium sp. Ash2021]
MVGYIISLARLEQVDESNTAELLIRASGLGPDRVRQTASTLAALGYVAVARRLFEIAGRRKRDLRPL